MPTPSEQKALAFLATIIVLAGAARLVRSNAQPVASPQEQRALADQVSAVDSSTDAKPGKDRKGRKMARKSRETGSMVASGVPTAAPYAAPYAAPSPPPYPAAYPPYPAQRVAALPPQASPSAPPSYPPSPTQPGLTSPRRAANRRKSLTSVTTPESQPAQPLDLDQATAEQIDQLPRVGPAIAARIVANRDSFGPFGSLPALKRVKGMGPATLQRLAPLVTFSGRPASSASRVPYY